MAAPRVDEEKCTGCRICITSCPEPGVIKMKDNKKVTIDGMRCKVCYLCVSQCARNALIKDEGK